MPEHLHAIWTLPDGDVDYPGRWKAIKGAFTRAVVKAGVRIERNARGEYALWQPRYWEHTIADEEDYRRHVDYIHFNPVKHGWANRVIDWQHSSLHRYVRQGILPSEWGGGDDEGQYGNDYHPGFRYAASGLRGLLKSPFNLLGSNE